MPRLPIAKITASAHERSALSGVLGDVKIGDTPARLSSVPGFVLRPRCSFAQGRKTCGARCEPAAYEARPRKTRPVRRRYLMPCSHVPRRLAALFVRGEPPQGNSPRH